jgi:two-component system sensor histidine kinase RpfC
LMPPLALLWLRGELDGVSSQRADFAPARFEVAEPIRQKSPLPAAERIAVPLSIASPAAARDDNAGARIISLARAADASRRRTEVMPATPALIASGAQILAFDDPFARHRARVAPLRVLVADDQAATRLLLSSMLEKAGHSVVTVEGGEQLLDHLVQHRVDVVLADVHMPGLCGLEAVRQARFFDHDDQRTPFIAISADASEAARTDAVDAGFTGFLAKPVGAEQLLGTLVAVCAPGDGATSHGPVVRRAADNTVVLDIGLLADLCDLKLGFDFVNRFIDQCARDTVACLADLERSGRDGDWRLLVEALRALEGVARMGGANRLAARCAEHLRTGPRDRWSAWRSTLDDLRLHAQAVREQLPLAMETMRQRYDAGRGGRR